MKINVAFAPVTLIIDTPEELKTFTEVLRRYPQLEESTVRMGWRPSIVANYAEDLFRKITDKTT